VKIFRSSRVLLLLALGAFLCASTLSASPLFGSFDFSGTITVIDNTSITWTLPPPNKALVGSSSGSFAGLTGSQITIDNLTNPPDVVDGTGFPNQAFISFPTALPDLLINFIAPGAFGPGQCGAAPASGQVCTLPGSPFSFVNAINPINGKINSSATFLFSGVSSDGMSNWQGIFTAQFAVPYQTVFATLATTGQVTNTYSATITASAIPEPNTWLLVLGAGGVLVGCLRKKRVG